MIIDPSTLRIFIGYPADAVRAAETIAHLEAELNEHLRITQTPLPTPRPFTDVDLWTWNTDAIPLVGGQAEIIDPQIAASSIGVFVFQDRLGAITVKELNLFRERGPGQPLLVFFASNPEGEITDPEVIEYWKATNSFRQELQSDWVDPDSMSVKPMPLYGSVAELATVASVELRRLIEHIVSDHGQGRFSHPDQTGLKDPMSSAEYSSTAGNSILPAETEVDFGLVSEYRSSLRPEALEKLPTTLSDLSFLRAGAFAKAGRLTETGILLFRQLPSLDMPGAAVYCVRYDGASETTTRDVLQALGPATDQIKQARDFVAMHVQIGETPTADAAAAQPVYSFPMICVREVIANAVSHRDYNNVNRSVQVRVFVDRIEVESPGTWLDLSPSESRAPIGSLAEVGSFRRNPNLALALSWSQLIESLGSGIATALLDCEAVGAPEPEVDVRADRVVIYVYPGRRARVKVAQARSVANRIEAMSQLKNGLKVHSQVAARWAQALNVFGFGYGRGDLTGDLTVPLDFSAIPRRFRPNDVTGSLVHENDLLSSGHNLIILGDPGAGKTTTVKRLTLSLLLEFPPDGVVSVPIAIQLRQHAENSDLTEIILQELSLGNNFVELLVDAAPADGGRDSDRQHLDLLRALCELLDEVGAVVILDGLDELPGYQRLIEDLERCASLMVSSQLIVTCRSGSFSQIAGFDVVEIEPISDDQIESVVVQYLGSDGLKFLQLLDSGHNWRSLASRPLFLMQMMTIYDRTGSLPDRRTSLLRSIVRLSVQDWDEQRRVRRSSRYAEFDVESKMDFLSNLAYELTVKRSRLVFAGDELEAAYLAIGERFGLPEGDAGLVARELESHTGLLVEHGDEFSFAHLGIAEYLAANYLVMLPNAVDRLTGIVLTHPSIAAMTVALSSEPQRMLDSVVLHLHDLGPGSPPFEQFVELVGIEQPTLELSEALKRSDDA